MTDLSERTQVMVELPLSRLPEQGELHELMKTAFKECRKLIGRQGKILGFTRVWVAEHKLTSQPTFFVEFACEAPVPVQRAAMS